MICSLNADSLSCRTLPDPDLVDVLRRVDVNPLS
jgi:hypothetical protein